VRRPFVFVQEGLFMIKVGLVGYGLGGKVFHAPLIHLAPDLELYAVCSRSEEKQNLAKADYPNIKTYSDYEALSGDEQVDLVVLATPHDTHAPMSILAMNAGKDVVTDKVMCLNETEAKDMIAASKQNDVLLSIFQNRRWDGDFLTLQKLVADQVLGNVYTVESNITSFGGAPSGWRAWQASGGGRVRDWGAHLIDQALQLIDSPVKRVFADFQYHYPAEKADVESTAMIHLQFSNDIRFFIELGSAWMYPKPRFHVRGEMGSFRKYGVDPQEAAMKLGTFGLSIPEDPARYQMRIRNAKGKTEESSVSILPGKYRTYYDNIGASLAHGEGGLVQPERCLEGIRGLDAVLLSAQREEAIILA